MQVSLYIDNRNVDLNEDIDIRLNKEFEDPESFIITDVNYSYEVELPVTTENRSIFGFSDVVSVTDKFNRVYDAQLYADEVLLLDGKFIINEINAESYKGNLYVPAKKELTDVLGDRTLKELVPHYKTVNSLEDIDKINCYVGGITGSDVVLPAEEERDNHVCFPYVLYGWPYNKPNTTTDKYYQNLNFDNTTFNLNNVFPSFNVLSVLKDMFKTEGYTLTGNVFNNEKLAGLYQTYYESADLWKTDRMTPYHLSFSCDYTMCKYIQEISAWNLSETAEEFDEDYFRFWADNPVWSDNTTFTSIDNKYEMMRRVETEGYTGAKRVIVIPVSGWYQISSHGTVTLPNYNMLQEFPNMKVTGWKSRYDDSSFNQSAWEFQIKKGVPKENVQHYGYNFALPCVPVDMIANEDDRTVIDRMMWYLNGLPGGFEIPTAMKIMGNEIQRRYGKNGKTTLVKNFSGFDVSDFIAGAKFGNQMIVPNKFNKYRWNQKLPHMSLYDVSKAPQIYNKPDGFKDLFPNLTSDYLILNSEDLSVNNTYGYHTAQILVNEDGMANFDGYNTLKARQSGSNTIYSWDTSNYGARSYPGQINNSASTSSNTSGQWNINTCVWLEEGDTVYTEFLGAYNNQHEKNDTSDKQCGCTNARLSFDFSIGLVNTSKDWKPTEDDPIKTGQDLETIEPTDMNVFLPSIKCNDYLNNFLKTFNCRLSRVDESTYSLDWMGKDDLFTNTVSIDPYCHNKDASFKRINLPSSIIYKFKVDAQEEGYVHGNDSPYHGQQQWLFNQPNHTGELLIENPNNTSGSEKKTESLWSYTWLKTIKLSDNTIIPAPVICDSKLWGDSYTYESVQREKLQTEKTMRLFYIYNKQRLINADTTIPELNYIRITGQHKFRLLIADAFHWEYGKHDGHSYIGERADSFIDYDNRRMNTLNGNRKTITDNFFDLSLNGKQYEVTISCILPTFVYWDINKGSRVLFDDSLWKVKSVDGFDVSEQQPCELTLLSLT